MKVFSGFFCFVGVLILLLTVFTGGSYNNPSHYLLAGVMVFTLLSFFSKRYLNIVILVILIASVYYALGG